MNKHLKALTAVLLYAKDPEASAEFYEKLGFDPGASTDGTRQVTLGTTTVTLVDRAKAKFQQDAYREPKGAGLFLMCKVEDIDGYHQELVGKGLKPSSAPRDWPWGNREFAIKDPDGYKIVFWQKVP